MHFNALLHPDDGGSTRLQMVSNMGKTLDYPQTQKITSNLASSNYSILYKEPTRCNFGSIVYYSLQDYSTCFGRFLRPSLGVLTTVVAATGACHGSG